MMLRKRIHALLSAVAVVAALPMGTLHAAEAALDTSAVHPPRLIDPTSPPSGDLASIGATSPASPAPASSRTPETRQTSRDGDGDPAVMNQPAVDDIELQMNADVLRYIAFFTGGGRSTFERWLKRSGRYMELFRTVLQREGLPPDLVHLVFVESGFNVNARSYAAAVGPWQFMRATSLMFGLNVNQWVDERKDPEKATVAAARYLKHLYGIFGDWPLALASYNAGEGTVMRAIKHQGTTNYWELRLPKETENYVPQFMAALAISRDPTKYGFAGVELDDPMRFDEVALKGAVDLRAIAKLAGCSYEELKLLNPSARTAMMRGQGGITSVRVPEGKSETIQRNLAAGAELPSVNLTVRHRVRRGETLRKIATEYSVNATELARVNNLGRGRPLRRGMMLTVPSSFKAPKPEVLASGHDDPRASTDYVPQKRIGLPGRIEGNSVPIDRVTHTVRKGETLRTIAARHGVSVSDLRQWNRIQTPGVRLGARLRIRSRDDEGADGPRPGAVAAKESVAPATSDTRSAAKPAKSEPTVAEPVRKTGPRLHTVDRDDTIASVARRYGVATDDLRFWNGLRKDEALEPGRVLEVAEAPVADARSLDTPAGGKSSARLKAKPAMVRGTHTVRAGETIIEIAARHNVSVEALRKLNKLRSTRVAPGQVLRLPT